MTVAAPGDYGKPRPALVIQSDFFNAAHASITVAPLTSTLLAAPLFRIALEPSSGNGLKQASQVMVDKIITLPRAKIGRVVGTVGDDAMIQVTRALAVWLGIA